MELLEMYVLHVDFRVKCSIQGTRSRNCAVLHRAALAQAFAFPAPPILARTARAGAAAPSGSRSHFADSAQGVRSHTLPSSLHKCAFATLQTRLTTALSVCKFALTRLGFTLCTAVQICKFWRVRKVHFYLENPYHIKTQNRNWSKIFCVD